MATIGHGEFLVLLFALFIYPLPSWIAVRRRHPRRGPIAALNFLTGWTVIGWIAALAWALGPVD